MFINFRELSHNQSLPTMLEHMASAPYDGQEKIVQYLLNGGEMLLAQGSRDRDIFTGEYIKDEVLLRTDGKYEWGTPLAYYVEKYNLRMPEEFEQHILSQ